MKTDRKPAPIQARTEPWAVQFIRFVDQIGHFTADDETARNAVSLAFGCMADLGNFNGNAYSTARAAALAYARAVACQSRMRAAYNATPWRDDELPASVAAALAEAESYCRVTRHDLECALRDLRPSLPMT
jgi:hypothetical protein